MKGEPNTAYSPIIDTITTYIGPEESFGYPFDDLIVNQYRIMVNIHLGGQIQLKWTQRARISAPSDPTTVSHQLGERKG